MIITNPCLQCGACCAFYRVSFYWAESDPSQGGIVPESLTEDITPFIRCMKGTNQAHPHCIALRGEIGKRVHCAIYPNRPSVCKAAGVQYTRRGIYFPPGEYHRCSKARAAYGMPPLPLKFLHPASRRDLQLVLTLNRKSTPVHKKLLNGKPAHFDRSGSQHSPKQNFHR